VRPSLKCPQGTPSLTVLNGSTTRRCREGTSSVVSGGDIAITASRHRLDERRPGGIVAECRAQPFDGGVEAVLEVNERAVWPQTAVQFVSRDDVSRALEQRAQDGERLALKLEARRADSQLAGAQVERECAKPHWIRWYNVRETFGPPARRNLRTGSNIPAHVLRAVYL
jgi:hypothetical protein